MTEPSGLIERETTATLTVNYADGRPAVIVDVDLAGSVELTTRQAPVPDNWWNDESTRFSRAWPYDITVTMHATRFHVDDRRKVGKARPIWDV